MWCIKISPIVPLIVLCACGTAPPSVATITASGAGDNTASGMTIVSGISCNRLGSSGTTLEYESVIYSTGDRFVECKVNAESYSHIYKNTQDGSKTGACTSNGYLFTSQSGVNQAYSNVQGTFGMSSVDCSTF